MAGLVHDPTDGNGDVAEPPEQDKPAGHCAHAFGEGAKVKGGGEGVPGGIEAEAAVDQGSAGDGSICGEPADDLVMIKSRVKPDDGLGGKEGDDRTTTQQTEPPRPG